MLLIMSHKRNELGRKMSCFSSMSNVSQRVQNINKSVIIYLSFPKELMLVLKVKYSKVNGILT